MTNEGELSPGDRHTSMDGAGSRPVIAVLLPSGRDRKASTNWADDRVARYRCRERHREADVAKTVKRLIALALIGLVITTGCGSGSDSDQKGGEMSTSHNSDPEAALRTKPSFEAAQKEYRDAMRDMANQVAALVPGLTWQTKEDSWRGCGGEYGQTSGVQVYVYIVFAGPVPDDKWAPALEIVKDGAARLGSTNMTTLVDKPGDRDHVRGRRRHRDRVRHQGQHHSVREVGLPVAEG